MNSSVLLVEGVQLSANVKRYSITRWYLKVSPINVGEYPKHLFMNRFDDALLEV